MTHDLDNLLNVAQVVLTQAVELVRDRLDDDAQLEFQSHYIPGSTIGKHLRHAKDHFGLLLDSEVGGEMSYDVRARGVVMERSREAAVEELEGLIAKLKNESTRKRGLDEPLTLHAVTPQDQAMKTSFGRELWFASLHAVHHWSMVRVVAGELGIQLEESFGFAPSTLVHHKLAKI